MRVIHKGNPLKNLFRHRLDELAIVSLVLCTGYAGTAAGQVPDDVPGLTNLQQPTAAAVQFLCPQLPAPNPNGTLTERLSNSCTSMVVTALVNQGKAPVTNPFNLNISDDELKRGIQAISPVQMNAQKQISVESSKMSLVGSRLLDLRGGARGPAVGMNGRKRSRRRRVVRTPRRLGRRCRGRRCVERPWVALSIWGMLGRCRQTDLQDASYKSFSVLAGADYRVSDKWVVGGAFSYSDTHSDYEQSLGNVKARTTGVAGYATYYVDTWYVDGFIAYGSIDYDSTRKIFILSNNPTAQTIDTSATAKPNGDQWSASIGVGRSFEMAPYTITPTARLGYIWVKNKAFTENEPINGLGLSVDSRNIESLQTALGGTLSMVVNSSVGVFGPYATANWLHECKNGTPSITSKYIADPFALSFSIPTASPTRDYAVVALGTSATLPNNLSGFAQLSGAIGLKNESNYGFVLGLRKQF